MNMTIRNQNAFPQKQPRGAQIAYGDKPGMTLRQYYAGLALQAVCPRPESPMAGTYEEVARQAVALADALCEELAKIS